MSAIVRMPHSWVLVSYEDPEGTEVCTDCGAQRDRSSPLLPDRAGISGGWRADPVDAEYHDEHVEAWGEVRPS